MLRRRRPAASRTSVARPGTRCRAGGWTVRRRSCRTRSGPRWRRRHRGRCRALTTVPISAQPVNSANAVSAGTGSVSLSTGSDSPVSTDSSQPRLATEIRRRSAGTMSPSRRSTRSPGTRSATSTVPGFAVAGDHGLVMDLVVQRFGGPLGPILVDESEAHRQGDDHADDDGVALLPDEIGRQRCREQQREQRRAQLMPQHRPEPGLVGGHGVRPPLSPATQDLRAGQAEPVAHPERAQHIGRAEPGRQR